MVGARLNIIAVEAQCIAALWVDIVDPLFLSVENCCVQTYSEHKPKHY